MKAVEIAAKNHITGEQILKICEDLGITCADENSEISDKDLFLIEKKIETTKAEKTRKAMESIEKKGDKSDKLKSEAGKKIKLKRKVHIINELITDKTEHKKEGEEKKPVSEEKKEATTSQHTHVKREIKPREPFDPNKPRPHRERTDFNKSRFNQSKDGKDKSVSKEKLSILENKFDSKDKESITESTKETSRKKLKGKGKDKKDKDKIIEKKFREDEEKDFLFIKRKQHHVTVKKEIVTPEYIEITETITVGELSHKLNIKANEVIAKLMKLGVMATINQVVDAETAEILASEYNTVVKVVSLYDETVIKMEEEDKEEDRTHRPPIVTIMGHVDHGKTKLLDTIRTTNVVDQEFGGITQHIGAYSIVVNDKQITFLDTPGHEAFTTMRARGAAITDIVVLVVAVNDGVMPQTIEAIHHAKEAKVPVIVALNKIDLPDANPMRVKQELMKYELISEEWGGTTLFAEISAKSNINIDHLLELILIQAEMLELKANKKIMAKGAVIESKLDIGRGAVPTILVQNGTLRIGDPFVVGIHFGKVRAMFDDKGKPITEAGPSTPIEVLGITGIPSAGDPVQVVESEKYARQISQKRRELKRLESAKKVKKVTLENLNEMIKEGEIQELKVIIKADVDGSSQALTEALEKLSTGEIRVKVIHSGTGTINDSDIMLASASNAVVIGYHVRPSAKVSDLAERENVDIKYYNIIFEATDSIKAAVQGMLKPDIKEEITGTGDIIKTFKISKVGTVAGAIVLTGKLHRTNKLRLLRDGVVIYDNIIKSLKRFQNETSEVDTSQECGFTLEGFNDIKEGDTFEGYRTIEVARTLD